MRKKWTQGIGQGEKEDAADGDYRKKKAGSSRKRKSSGVRGRNNYILLDLFVLADSVNIGAKIFGQYANNFYSWLFFFCAFFFGTFFFGAFFFSAFLAFCFSALSFLTISKTESGGLGHISSAYSSGTSGRHFL